MQSRFVVQQEQDERNKYTIAFHANNDYYFMRLNMPLEGPNTSQEAKVECDESLTLLLRENISLVRSKLEYCSSVEEFAREISNLIERLVFERSSGSMRSQSISFAYYNTLLRDLEEFGWGRISSISDSLLRFTLTLQDPSHRPHEIMITLPTTYPQGAPSCQMAIPEPFTFRWNSTNTIRDIASIVFEALKKYDQVWKVLNDFDRHCVVIDPVKPTFQHNYRRIFLENQCSLLYTVNIGQPYAIGEWRFLGPASQVSIFEQRLNNNLSLWDTGCLPRSNLETLLEITLPKPSEASSSQYEIECAICYSYQLDVRGKTSLPEKMCPNEKISMLILLLFFLNPLWSCIPLLLSYGNDAIKSDDETVL